MTAAASPFDRRARFALIVASVVLLASGLGFDLAVKQLNAYLRKLPIELRGSFDTIPRLLGAWRAVGNDQSMDEAMIEQLGTRIYLDRDYAYEGNPSQGALNMHLAYYTGMIDTVPHVPERCFFAAGLNVKSQPKDLLLHINRDDWRIDSKFVNVATQEPYRIANFRDIAGVSQPVRMPVPPAGEFRIRTSQFEDPARPEIRFFAGYLFIANGRTTPTALGVKALAFDLSQRYAYYCKVQFTYAGPDATEEKFIAHASDLLNQLFPELMHRLPDWSEVERRTETSSGAKPVMQP